MTTKIDNEKDAYSEIVSLMSKFAIPGKVWHPIDFADYQKGGGEFDLTDDAYMSKIGAAMDDAYDALSDANDDDWYAISEALSRAFGDDEEAT